MDDISKSRDAVLVTGVSTGIGRALAEDLIDAGYFVFGSVRRLEDAASLTARNPSTFEPVLFDVTDAEAVQTSVAVVTDRLGGGCLRALVNNAGISLSGPLLHQPLEDFRRTFEVNVFGTLTVVRAFLPLLGARGEGVAQPGRIVNIGSVQGAMTVPFMAAYSASKHALEAISQGLRRELLVYGIEVATIEPSFVRSQLFEKATVAWQNNRYGGTLYERAWQQFNESLASQESKASPPSRVTRAVRHAIESARPRTRYPLDPIWTLGRILPDRVFDRLIISALGIQKSLRRVAVSTGAAQS